MELKDSKTKINLMKAFIAESQARNRYDIAAKVAKKENLHIIEMAFTYTANQEKAHGKVFYDKLKEFSGQKINIDFSYPIDNYDKTLDALKAAVKNEYDEWQNIYSDFGKIAEEEGFLEIGETFKKIASIENIHGNRFKTLAEELESGNLFKKGTAVNWMCTNCGYIYEGIEAPEKCPVCSGTRDYFIIFEKSLFQL